MKLQERMELNYCKNLLAYGNSILRELQYNEFVLPSQFGSNRRSLLVVAPVCDPKQDKSALGRVWIQPSPPLILYIMQAPSRPVRNIQVQKVAEAYWYRGVRFDRSNVPYSGAVRWAMMYPVMGPSFNNVRDARNWLIENRIKHPSWIDGCKHDLSDAGIDW